MSDEGVSAYTELLLSMRPPEWGWATMPLLDELIREQVEKKLRDAEWLASLSERDLRIELTRRRIAALEARYRVWWETNMAWRFRPDPPDSGDGW